MKYFTHLHLHTEFSLLDGAIKPEQVVAFAKEHELPAIGISDHGNIFGAVKFFEQAKKEGIKPVLGMEAYITEDASIKDNNNRYHHLLIIVENKIGYKNLCKLISFSYQEGFYFKPRIDYKVLEQYSEGLIVSTACLGGHIPKLLLGNKEPEARERIEWYVSTFGRSNFFFELHPIQQPEQEIVNRKLCDLSKEMNIDLIATCDAHYPKLEDHEAHEVMLALQTQKKLADKDRFSFGDIRAYMRTPQEMLELFSGNEQALWNTGRIADRCEFDFETGKLHFPCYEIPNNQHEEPYFKQLCQSGLDQLIQNGRIPLDQTETYQQRLKTEMDLIINMGFVGYFLIVSDFIQWAKRNGIPVGPGRGSAAGSLVSWALKITNIDPLKYNLLFERFLNPERVSMPDIDVDFCIEGRERVIDYVREKYGNDKVCQIVTFGTMKSKMVIKDVARVHGILFEDSNMITKLISDDTESLEEAIKAEPRLQNLIAKNSSVHDLFEIAFKLEGLTRHASKHAAGIVISPKPIDEVLPVFMTKNNENKEHVSELVTQYEMTALESLGFLKIDFLGLKNLTLVDRVLKMVHENRGDNIDLNLLELDDDITFSLLSDGETSGVFQLESDGIKEVLRKLQPTTFEDIIAVNALYRPGPLKSGMVDDFIERRHGRQRIKYLLPELEPILKETYGVIVYQEQVMKIASSIAGYSLGEADILRRAMGKKKVEVMAQQRELFISRAGARGTDTKKAGELFDLMAYFAGYGFNKSHSAAYALLAYQTAYLKAHYPTEFMACLISLESADAAKMTFYLQEARAMGINVLPPDINGSEVNFSVSNGDLLFGLRGIKQVGEVAISNIIETRNNAPFVDLQDFCVRVNLSKVNKRVIENLIKAGAFDKLPGHRAQNIAELPHILKETPNNRMAKAVGQTNMFEAAQSLPKCLDLEAQEGIPPWATTEELKYEKEIIGFYISGHPIDPYKKHIDRLNVMQMGQLTPDYKDAVACCGLVKNRKDITTKKGDRMCFLRLEDKSGNAEIVVFPKLFKKVSSWLDSYTVFVVKGEIDSNAKTLKIKASELVPLELFFEYWSNIRGVSVVLPGAPNKELIDEVKSLVKEGNTPLEIQFNEGDKQLRLQTTRNVKIDAGTIAALEKLGVQVRLKI